LNYFYDNNHKQVLKLIHADENGALFEQKNLITVYYGIYYIENFIIKVNKIHLAMEEMRESE
jgi:hypothetical protein